MPKNQETTTDFTISHSHWLKITVDCLHFLSMLACWLNDLPIQFKLLLALMVITSWRFHRKATEADSTYLRYTPASGWAISLDNAGYSAVNILPSTVAGKIVTILHFKRENHRKSLVIFKDAVAANDYRRLTVLLKISG